MQKTPTGNLEDLPILLTTLEIKASIRFVGRHTYTYVLSRLLYICGYAYPTHM